MSITRWRCIEDFKMDHGDTAFIAGNVYERENGLFKSEVTLGYTHVISNDLIAKHFVQVSDYITIISGTQALGKRVYICGPISGLPDGNKPAFEAADKMIREHGFHPINPHVLCLDIVRSHQGTEQDLWTKCMKRDITYMLDCDFVVLLNGWHKSRGAMVEINTASAVGIPCIPLTEFLNKYAPVQD